MKHFRKGLKVLIDPTRGRIAEMFQERAMCVTDIRIAPGVCRPAGSNRPDRFGAERLLSDNAGRLRE
ncbi:hypothetical protein [Syntrophobacter fumaroxidans]|uniref:hypothetical protein n=1 Tax=Syntrophobacter fumaroxidans TaxID=119484 RepID=UPI00031B406A|nr:hypothetical protein [Syntrophobacter fumaroxidans]